MTVMRSKDVRAYFQSRGASPTARGKDGARAGAKSKYRNVPTVVDGVRFASKAEAKRDAELLLLEKADKIHSIQRQPKFDLYVNGKKVCRYVGDWSYRDGPAREHNAQLVVEDRKGVLTPAFKIKWALAKALYPHIEFRLS